jgi:hypothetical protein
MKKTTLSKPRRAKSRSTEVETSVDMMDGVEEMEGTMDTMQDTGSNKRGRMILVGIVILALIGYVAYRYSYVITPAVVDGKPIYVWDYMWKLHTQFGRDQLNSMVTEQVIEQAVASANVSVPQSDIDAEVAAIEKEASSSGGLAAVLEAQRLSRAEFEERIKLQLSVKKILADKISVTDQEINDTYSKNKDFYKGMTEPQAKEQVKKQLEDQKFQTEASTWLADVREKANVEVKFPGLQTE